MISRLRDRQPVTICTSRFSDASWQCNQAFREQHGLACAYVSPDPLAGAVPVAGIVMVLEMNNTQNRLEGVGLVRNQRARVSLPLGMYDSALPQYAPVAPHVWFGRHHVTRAEMLRVCPTLLQVLELALFRGRAHVKRGRGVLALPRRLRTLVLPAAAVELDAVLGRRDAEKDRTVAQMLRRLFLYMYPLPSTRHASRGAARPAPRSSVRSALSRLQLAACIHRGAAPP